MSMNFVAIPHCLPTLPSVGVRINLFASKSNKDFSLFLLSYHFRPFFSVYVLRNLPGTYTTKPLPPIFIRIPSENHDLAFLAFEEMRIISAEHRTRKMVQVGKGKECKYRNFERSSYYSPLLI